MKKKNNYQRILIIFMFLLTSIFLMTSIILNIKMFDKLKTPVPVQKTVNVKYETNELPAYDMPIINYFKFEDQGDYLKIENGVYSQKPLYNSYYFEKNLLENDNTSINFSSTSSASKAVWFEISFVYNNSLFYFKEYNENQIIILNNTNCDNLEINEVIEVF